MNTQKEMPDNTKYCNTVRAIIGCMFTERLASARFLRPLLLCCLLAVGGSSVWGQTAPQPTPRYVGTLENTGRKINSISLKGTTTAQQTITCGDNSSYMNKTSEHFIIREGETTTATFAWSGSWMHGYIYIDKNQDGTFAVGDIETSGIPKATSELVAYSAYQVNGTYKNSAGNNSGDNPGLNPPTFTAPSTAGIYYIRYKTDWNYIGPEGNPGANNKNSFQQNSGVAIDVSLWVVKEYTLTIVDPDGRIDAGASVSIDGGTESSYVASGTVLCAKSALTVSDVHASDSRGDTPEVTVSGTNITVTFHAKTIVKTPIASLSEITESEGYYVLTQDIDASGASIIDGFRGTLDGQFHKITGLSHAIFSNVNGATIKNVILDEVSISSGTNVGAIANEASGDARIYNCGVIGGSISGSANVGSIVGTLSGNARVLNCFSYAEVSGSTVGGIVGNNNGTTVTTNDRNNYLSGTGSMVFNCMFFGMVSGSNKYPVYGGNAIENVSGVNTYNYFLYDGTDYTSVNSAAGVADKSLLNRFDMYRGMLNSHRDLCAMYINNTQSLVPALRHDIALWYYDDGQRETVPYLQLEQCQTKTRRTLDRVIPSESEAYKGKQVGTVSCTFNINGQRFTETLPMTDMNTANWDYTWGKIVLPFANEFSGWTMPASGSTAYDNIITGWEITSISGGTAGSWDGSYDLCNPDCTAKDLYSNNNYVWAQGGNYVVPTGVTSITFTAHIVRCVYLADSYVDIAYNGEYTSATNLGTQLSNDKYNGKTVYHSLTNAFAQLQNKTNPADQAIVLVGNYHYNQAINADGLTAAASTTSYSAKAATIMSIDADNNQVPDYAFPQFHDVGSGRTSVPPLRFDFVCSPGIGISSYTRAGYLADVDILHSKGWFEVTETSMIHMTEFEIRPQNFTANSPLILNGGIYDQFKQSSTDEYENNGNNDKLLYIRIGGKAYVKEFWPGHKNANANMTINGKPINVNGGQIDQCYMNSDIHDKVINGDVHFYCNGGYIKEFLGAYQGRITGNMTTKVDHALIDAFYGGGSDNAYGATAQIAGNIDNTINNSYVKFYCAGPKFGTMAAGKTVTTTAKGTTFGEYYGAGYGGTALTRNQQSGASPTYGTGDFTFNRDWSNYTGNRLQYNSSLGTGVGYDFLFNMYAGGNHRGNAAIYVNYATLSLASTHNVSSTLTGCTLEHDFYGGGCQGKVDGTITNTLTNCSVAGSVFGGGYKASATPIEVYPATQPTYAVFKAAEGLFTDFGTVEPETYSWVSGTDGAVDNTAKTIGTSVDMTQMGLVTGAITTTVSGGTVGANVFGGGNESPSDNDATVIIKQGAQVSQNAFGGGNIAPVGGNTAVMLGEAGVKDNTHIINDVYGGGALADVSGNTAVTLLGGTVHDVYGGGLGQLADDEHGVAAVAALVDGNTLVTLNGSIVTGQIFGANNLNGTPLGSTKVLVQRTTAQPGAADGAYHVKAVYGGGNLAAHIPSDGNLATALSEVYVEGCDNSIEYVYGGGNAASSPATKVTIEGGEIYYVFGGGNGKTEPGADLPNPGADVGYKDFTYDQAHEYGLGTTEVNIWGGVINSVFGGSNTKGNIRVSSNVNLDDKTETYGCTFEIGEVYGAGNEAEMYGNGKLVIGCIPGLEQIYGGAKNADLHGDVTLTITNGTFGKVFGGNNIGGKLNGSITVNIEETGCRPIVIGELYGGGNLAAYSIYGYEDALDANGKVVVKTSGASPKADPQVNILSCTHIGTVYGGGLGESAVMVGNPTVNVQEVLGAFPKKHYNTANAQVVDGTTDILGSIGTVFGGGNAAKVIGNTTVNIGTTEGKGANILGNVYGGGNQADVTGKTNVTVGVNPAP